MASIEVKLEHPFVYDPDEPKITSIEIPRPQVKHIRGLSSEKLAAGDIDEMLSLLQALLAVPPSYLDMLDIDDFQNILEAVKNFFPDGPATGEMQ